MDTRHSRMNDLRGGLKFRIILTISQLILTVLLTFLGPFSNLRMELTFFRKSVYYLIQIYIPSGMIVALSWVGDRRELILIVSWSVY